MNISFCGNIGTQHYAHPSAPLFLFFLNQWTPAILRVGLALTRVTHRSTIAAHLKDTPSVQSSGGS